jgi:glycosyltransferase involved in cell wall biosynthesis
MKFALIVPALNEEQAIAGTLRRCLAARATVTANTPVREMVVVFVNDGSTDGTQAVVDGPEFKEVVKVRFDKNRGYGAAIKAGFKATDADLVGFIDGDGTCDPEFCVNLVNDLLNKNADVAIAARLQPDTEMPAVRQLGNRIFAALLGAIAGKSLTDTASGFRVIKRASLKLMTPLPDRLHYTPAMSAICMLDPRLSIIEVNGMKYKEREGRSKLNVIKDGFRFLFVIMFSACCYSPIKTVLGFSAMTALFFAVLGFAHDWMTALMYGSPVIMTLLAAGIVVHQLNYLLIGPRTEVGPVERMLQKLVYHRTLLKIGAVSCALGGLGLLFSGTVVKWFGSFGPLLLMWLCAGGALAGTMGVINRVIWAVGEKTHALVKDEYAFEGNPTVSGTKASDVKIPNGSAATA